MSSKNPTVSYDIDDRRFQEKLKKLEKGAVTTAVMREAAYRMRDIVRDAVRRGRGVSGKKTKKLANLAPSTLSWKRRMGFKNKGKSFRSTMTGSLLNSIKVKHSPTQSVVYVSGKGSTIIKSHTAGRFYAKSGKRQPPRPWFVINKSRKRKLVREVFRPMINRNIQQIDRAS